MTPISHDQIKFYTDEFLDAVAPPEYAGKAFYLTPETEIDGFLVVVDYAKEAVVNLIVHEIGGRYADGVLLVDTLPYMTAHIKYDGCSNVDFCPEGLHLCGVGSWQDHIQLMEHVYKFAFQLMGKEHDWN